MTLRTTHRLRRWTIIAGAALIATAPSLPAQQLSIAERATLIARADSLRAVALQLEGRGAAADEVISTYRSEIGLQERLGRQAELGTAWNLLGHVYKELAALDSAMAAYRRAIAARSAAGDPVGVASSTNNVANVHRDAGRLDSAIITYRHAVSMHVGVGALKNAAMTLRNLSLAQADSATRWPAQRDSAMHSLREAIAIHRTLGDSADRQQYAWALEDLGDQYERAADADSAIHYWQASLGIVTESEDRSRESALLYGIGALHDMADRLDSAHHYFSRAAAAAGRQDDLGEQAGALYRVANIHLYRGESAQAMMQYAASLTLARQAGDSARIGWALLGMANESRIGGRLDAAVQHVNESLRTFRTSRNVQGEAAALGSYARYFQGVGQRDSAVAMLQQVMDIWRARGDTGALVRSMVSLANVLRPRTPDEVRVIGDSARRTYAAAQQLAAASGDVRAQAQAASDFAWFLSAYGPRAAAREQAATALAIHRRVGDVMGQANALRVIGLAHTTADSVVAYLGAAIELAQRAGALPTERMLHGDIGETLLSLSQRDPVRVELVDSALVHLRHSLALARQTSEPAYEARVLEFIGHAYKLTQPARWLEAAAHYDSAWTVLDRLRQAAGSDAARISFSEQNGNISRHLYAAWSQRARQTGSQADRRRALAAAERGRARALLDMLGGGPQSALAGPLDAVADSLIARTARPGRAALMYFVGADTTTITVLLPSGEIADHIVTIPSDTVVARVAALRRALDVDSAAVRAVSGSLEPPADSSATTRGLGLGHGSAGESAQAGMDSAAAYLLPSELREQLDRNGVQEVVVITDGPISVVPFAALPYDTAGTPLGIRATLRFTPSLAVLADAESRRVASGATPLVVGNPAMPTVTDHAGRRVQLAPLPGAGSEARAVAAALGGAVLTGSAATESLVLARLPSASVVHLATHGYAYAAEHRVRDSFIALAAGGEEDGLLTVGEVLDEVPALQADLVVLSACQTALGTTTATEGTLGLQRAFLAKGARSLLVSLWSVDDAVTERMMLRFYEHWLGGASKAEALRRAQADVRQTHPNPRYWAAFQLVGAG